MKELAQLLNEMQQAGVIRNDALFGATAQMRYTEPVARLDADVLVAVGRAKDLTRILALLESGSVNREAIGSLAARHGLAEAWRRFETRFLND